MVRVAPGGVTSLSFRRDIRVFLASLVGFFIILIAALLFYLQRYANAAENAVLQRRDVVADDAARRIDELGRVSSPAVIETRLIYIRSLYNIDYASLRNDATALRIESGLRPAGEERITTRVTRVGLLTIAVGPPPGIPERRTVDVLCAMVLAATSVGTVLFLLFLPRIVRPLEQLLDQAHRIADRPLDQDDPTFLLETFRATIETLREQEAELKRLRAVDRARMDELEAVTATLTRSIRAGFMAFGADGRIVDINSAGRRLLDLEEARRAQGTTAADLFGESEFARELQGVIEARRELSRVQTNWSDGEHARALELTAVPLTGPEGKHLGTIAIFEDMSEIQALEQQLRERQRLADLGEVAAGIAHEFRNSLSTILGYLKLSRRVSADDSVTTRIDRAEREALSLARAVDSLLAVARPLHLDTLAEVDLAPLVKSVIDGLNLHDVETTLTPTVVRGDEALLARAIENVLRNAVESVAEKGSGSVVVTTAPLPAPTLVIHDTGVGLDPADAPRLLLPFQSDRRGGFGMGLALTKRIILAHGASLALDGVTGQSATVKIIFPRPADETIEKRYYS